MTMNFVDRSIVKTGVHLASISHFVCQGAEGRDHKLQVATVGGKKVAGGPGANNAGC